MVFHHDFSLPIWAWQYKFEAIYSLKKIVPTLIRKREITDGSFFDTTWLIFWHHMALFLTPIDYFSLSGTIKPRLTA
jgi:hypothetical protein